MLQLLASLKVSTRVPSTSKRAVALTGACRDAGTWHRVVIVCAKNTAAAYVDGVLTSESKQVDDSWYLKGSVHLFTTQKNKITQVCGPLRSRLPFPRLPIKHRLNRCCSGATQCNLKHFKSSRRRWTPRVFKHLAASPLSSLLPLAVAPLRYRPL